MTEITGIEVQLRAARQAASDADKLERSLDKLGRQGTQTETAFGKLRNSSAKTAGVFDRLKSSVFSAQSALKGLAVAGIAQQIGAAALATERITNALKFATGSAKGAADALTFVRAESDRLGLAATSTAQAFSGIAAAAQGTALQGDAVREIFLGVAEASSALSLSADDTQGALLALSQMISKGTVQAEELRGQLGERIPGAFQIAARAMGVTTAELGKMLEQGQVISEDFLPKFAAEMRRSFGDAATEASKGLQAAINRLTSAYDELLRTLAETGVIDAATRIISNLGNIVFNTATIFTNAKTAVVEFFDQFRDAPQTLSGTAAKLELLSKKIVKLSEQRAVSPFPEQLDERIAELRAEYDRVQKTFSELSSKPLTLNATQPSGIEPPPTPPSQALEILRAQLDKVAAATTQYNERIALLKKELAAGNIDQVEFNKLAGLAKEQLDKVIESTNRLGTSSGDASTKAKSLANSFQSLSADLQKQIALYGRTGETSQLRYELEKGALKDLSTDRKAYLLSLSKELTAMDANMAKFEEMQSIRERGLQIFKSTLPEAEQRQIQEAELQFLFDKGAFGEGQQAVETLERAMKNLRETSRGTGDVANDLGLTFSSAFEKAITQAESFKDVLGGLARDMVGIFTRRAVTEPLAAGISNFASGIDFGSIFGGTFHQGGIVGQGGLGRMVPAMAFADAPRYHNGGLSGFRPDERPAVLQVGEEVLPTSHPRHRNNQGNAEPPLNVTIYQSNDFRGANNPAESRAQAERIKQETIAAVEAGIERGGRMSRAVGRRL